MQYIIFPNLLNLLNASQRYFNGRDIGQDQISCHFSLADK